MWYNIYMTELNPNVPQGAETLPLGITKNVEGAHAIDADAMPALPENLPGSSILPQAIQDKITALEEEIRKTIDIKAASQKEFIPGTGPRINIAAFQEADRKWKMLSLEEKAKAIEAGQHQPIPADFREAA